MYHEDDRIAEQAIDTLYEYETLPEHVTEYVLMLFLEYDRYRERMRAVLPLVDRLDESRVDHAFSILDAIEDADDRRLFVDGLGEAGDPRTRDALRNVRRNDPDPGVQRAAARALEQLDE